MTDSAQRTGARYHLEHYGMEKLCDEDFPLFTLPTIRFVIPITKGRVKGVPLKHSRGRVFPKDLRAMVSVNAFSHVIVTDLHMF